ncbi:flagellar motor protein MotB [Nocardioides fonticola]|uniref:Flagellar motor protein MotB n=1 Tax=Nocardioides fonticola TaxID=450363 RepID=A0ABP7XCV2_9ACTN
MSGGHGGHGGRRPKHEEHEEHENHERWLVTYADMVTLLMVLFIVMFAMSQVDQKKFMQLKEGLAAGFGQSDSILDGNPSIQDQPGVSAMGPIAPNLSSEDLTAEQAKMVNDAVQQGMDQRAALARQTEYAAATTEAQRLGDVQQKLMGALAKRGLNSDVRTTIDSRGLVVSLVSRHVVFDADSAVLTARGQQVVDALAPVLKQLGAPLEIDGHTNQEPVKPKYFASDWDLSAARAVTVLRRLNEVFGIPADLLQAAAFGHTRPLIPVDRPDSQEINKRVDIVVLTTLTGASAAQLPDAAKSLGLPTAGTIDDGSQAPTGGSGGGETGGSGHSGTSQAEAAGADPGADPGAPSITGSDTSSEIDRSLTHAEGAH